MRMTEKQLNDAVMNFCVAKRWELCEKEPGFGFHSTWIDDKGCFVIVEARRFAEDAVADREVFEGDLARFIAARIGGEYAPPDGANIRLDVVSVKLISPDRAIIRHHIDALPPISTADVARGGAEHCLNTTCCGCRLALPAMIADVLDPCDTQERIDADALKTIFEYWGCVGTSCSECPAAVNGERPSQRYGLLSENCHKAQILDLLRRQRELDGRPL